MVGQYGSGSDIISSITDDQTNTYTKDKTQADATNSQSAVIARASNVAANTRVITINFSGATNYTQFSCMRVNNLATSTPVDTSGGQVDTSGDASWTTGNITTTQTDTFVVACYFDDTGSLVTAPTTYTADTGYTLWATDPTGESACQFKVVASASTFNPTITSSRTSGSVIALVVAYKTSAGVGGAPSANAEVVCLQFTNFNDSKVNFSGTSYTFNFSCPGVTVINVATDDGNSIYSSLSSSPSNTWTSTTPVTNGVTVRHVYATSASATGTLTLTVTVTSAPTTTTNPFELVIWGIAKGGAFDTSRSGSGATNSVPPVTTNNVLTTALTTAEANEVVLFYLQEVQQTVTNITASTGTALPTFLDLGEYELLVAVHDAGPAHLYAASATNYNFNVSWSDYEGGLQVSNWAAQAVAFKTQAASGCPKTRMLMGVGC